MTRRTRKRILVSDSRLMGEEPSFEGNLNRSQLARTLNWYNYYSDIKKNIRWCYTYMRETGYSKEEIASFKRSSSTMKNQNLCSLARMVSRGVTNECIQILLDQKIHKILSAVPKLVTPIQNKASKNVSNNLIADLDDLLDVFYKSNYKDIQSSESISKKYSPKIVSEALEYYKNIQKDVKEHDEYLTRRQFSKYIVQLNSIISTLTMVKTTKRRNAAQTRKPRTRKIKSAAKIVEKLQYAKNSATLNIASIKPEKIVDSKILLVFHLEYRELTQFEALDGKKLSVRGTVITNFDPKKSYRIKIRKPHEVIPTILTATQSRIKKLINSLTTKKVPARKRVNEKQILMRNFK